MRQFIGLVSQLQNNNMRGSFTSKHIRGLDNKGGCTHQQLRIEIIERKKERDRQSERENQERRNGGKERRNVRVDIRFAGHFTAKRTTLRA